MRGTFLRAGTRGSAFGAALVTATAMACGNSSSGGGSSSGSGTFSGMVDGTSFNVVSTLADLEPMGGGGNAIVIALSNRSVSCSVFSSDSYADLDRLQLYVPSAAPGTFRIYLPGPTPPPQPSAHAVLTRTNGACYAGASPVAVGGSITISDYSAATVAGTFDVSFGALGGFSGSFSAPICATTPDAGMTCTQ